MANPYSNTTLTEALADLSERLGDPGNVRWTSAELSLWIQEALSVWNALTGEWTNIVTLESPSGWIDTATGIRARNYAWSSLLEAVEYHLLEPPTGATWTGTDQFSIASLEQSAADRLNAVLDASLASLSVLPITVPASNADITLPPTTLKLARLALSSLPLYESDIEALWLAAPNYRQTVGTPTRYAVAGWQPLTVRLDAMQGVTADAEAILASSSTPDFASTIPLPNDWCSVLKWGILADMLTQTQEGRDVSRANYCEARFQRMLGWMKVARWLDAVYTNNVPVDTIAVSQLDLSNPAWESGGWPCLVEAGTDLVRLSSPPADPFSLSLSMVGNAPQPSAGTDYLQVAPGDYEAVIQEAQHLAMFDMGGAEFEASMPLHEFFLKAAKARGAKMLAEGILTARFESQDKQSLAKPEEVMSK